METKWREAAIGAGGRSRQQKAVADGTHSRTSNSKPHPLRLLPFNPHSPSFSFQSFSSSLPILLLHFHLNLHVLIIIFLLLMVILIFNFISVLSLVHQGVRVWSRMLPHLMHVREIPAAFKAMRFSSTMSQGHNIGTGSHFFSFVVTFNSYLSVCSFFFTHSKKKKLKVSFSL